MASCMIRPKRTKAEKKALYRTDYQEPIKSRREELKVILSGPEKERESRARRKLMDYIVEDSKRVSPTIYMAALAMAKAMPDKKEDGLTLWYWEEFVKWLQSYDNEEELRNRFLNPDIQMAALTQCHTIHKSLVSRAFNIDEKRLLEDVKENLQAKLDTNQYEKAADLALRYDLTGDYSFEDLVLPLLMCDDLVRAYRLMEGHPDLQKRCVQFLDELIDLSAGHVTSELEKYKKTPTSKFPLESFREGKILKKMIANNNEYKFDTKLSQYASKFNDFSKIKNLKYQIGKRYGENVSDEVYFQHMKECLFDASPSAREKVLFFLWNDDSQYREEKKIDAISFAIMLGLETCTNNELPGGMRDFFRDPDHRLQAAKDLLERRKNTTLINENEPLYVLEKEKKWPITVVKTADAFSRLCNSLEALELEANPFVGFDSEWSTGSSVDAFATKIALIQLFFSDNVWIVDCIALDSQEIQDDQWQEFARRLLRSPKIKVVGFDLGNDLRTFVAIPSLRNSMKVEDVENAYCLKRLTENVCEISMEILNLEKKTFKLADLTKKLLNIELDKAEQCSNWASRPLRKNQVVYAAMDAVVVVEAFNEIIRYTRKFSEMIDTSVLINESNERAPKKEKSRALARKLNTIPWVEIYETLRDHRDTRKPLVRSYDMEVIVDTMLHGFGYNLRRVGIDVMIPADVKEFREKLILMKNLGRECQRQIITVPSRSYESLRAEYDSKTTALADMTSKAPLEQLISFFDRFNIEIRREDEFVRCVKCNSRLLVKFPSPVLHFLHQYCVIYTQNVYRATMRDFPLEEWWDKMHQVDPNEYGGLEVKWSRPSARSNWYVATVPTGCLHITRNTVIHNNRPFGVEVRIRQVPDTEFHRPNVVFYVCGDCGTVNYDGWDSLRDSERSEYLDS